MATRNLKIDIQVDDHGAVKKLDDVDKGVDRIVDGGGEAKKSVEGLNASFLKWAAGIVTVTVAYTKMRDFVVSSVQEFLAAETANRRLTTALTAQGFAVPSVVQNYSDLASQFQRTTVFSDELITEMQALLVQVGDVAPGQMRAALTAATDLSSGLGIDLRTATILVGKAMQGEFSTLSRYGIQIDKTAFAAKGADAIFESLHAKFGGQAQAQLDTYAGKLARVGNLWSDYKQAVGANIAANPLLEATLRALTAGLERNADGTIKVNDAYQNMAGYIRESDALTLGWIPSLDGLVLRLELAAAHSNEVARAQERLLALPSPFKQLADDGALPAITTGMALFNEQVIESIRLADIQEVELKQNNEAVLAYAKAWDAVRELVADSNAKMTAQLRAESQARMQIINAEIMAVRMLAAENDKRFLKAFGQASPGGGESDAINAEIDAQVAALEQHRNPSNPMNNAEIDRQIGQLEAERAMRLSQLQITGSGSTPAVGTPGGPSFSAGGSAQPAGFGGSVLGVRSGFGAAGNRIPVFGAGGFLGYQTFGAPVNFHINAQGSIFDSERAIDAFARRIQQNLSQQYGQG